MARRPPRRARLGRPREEPAAQDRARPRAAVPARHGAGRRLHAPRPARGSALPQSSPRAPRPRRRPGRAPRPPARQHGSPRPPRTAAFRLPATPCATARSASRSLAFASRSACCACFRPSPRSVGRGARAGAPAASSPTSSKPDRLIGPVNRPRASSVRPSSDTAAASSDSRIWPEHGRRGGAAVLEQLLGLVEQPGERLRLVALRPLEDVARGPAQHGRLRLAEAVAGVEQEVDLAAVAARELVQRPGGERRLPDGGDGRRVVGLALRLELLREPGPRRHELLGRGRVESVERLVEIHPVTLPRLDRLFQLFLAHLRAALDPELARASFLRVRFVRPWSPGRGRCSTLSRTRACSRLRRSASGDPAAPRLRLGSTVYLAPLQLRLDDASAAPSCRCPRTAPAPSVPEKPSISCSAMSSSRLAT